LGAGSQAALDAVEAVLDGHGSGVPSEDIALLEGGLQAGRIRAAVFEAVGPLAEVARG